MWLCNKYPIIGESSNEQFVPNFIDTRGRLAIPTKIKISRKTVCKF